MVTGIVPSTYKFVSIYKKTNCVGNYKFLHKTPYRIYIFNTVNDAEKFLIKAIGKKATRVELEDNHGLHIEENTDEDN